MGPWPNAKRVWCAPPPPPPANGMQRNLTRPSSALGGGCTEKALDISPWRTAQDLKHIHRAFFYLPATSGRFNTASRGPWLSPTQWRVSPRQRQNPVPNTTSEHGGAFWNLGWDVAPTVPVIPAFLTVLPPESRTRNT